MSYKHWVLVVSLLFGCCAYSSGQVINTIAGNGSIGYAGDSNLATMAQLNALGVTIAPDGEIYIPDAANNRVRKINLQDTIYTVAGTGVAGYNVDSGLALTTLLYNPTSVAFDNAGNMFIADQRNQRVRKVDIAGTMTVIAGTGITGYSGDDSAAVNAKLNNPIGVAADTFGNVYIVDYGNNCVRKVNAAGIITTVAGTGVPGHTGDGGLATAATLDTPTCVAVDLLGNLYIADRSNNCIRKVDTAGNISNFAGSGIGTYGFGGDNGLAVAATLAHPYGVAVDKNGYVYIADEENQRIRRVNPSGVISTIVGSGTLSFCGDGGDPLLACLNHPKGVAIDDTGNVYIADAFNNRIRKVTGPLAVRNVNGKNAAIQLYPNPNTGIFTVEGYMKTMDENVNVQLCDIFGRTVINTQEKALDGHINLQIQTLQHACAGIYLLELTTDSERKSVLVELQ